MELEGVEHEALAGEAVLGLLGDGAGEGGTVTDDLLHAEPADDGAERTGEHLTGEHVDLALLAQEALGRGPDELLGATHLHDGDALERAADAVGRDGGRHADADLAAGESDDAELLHEGHHEDAGAHDDLLARGVSAAGLALAAGDDERLVGARHPDAADHEQDQDDDEDDEPDDGDEGTAHGGELLPVVGRRLGKRFAGSAREWSAGDVAGIVGIEGDDRHEGG